VPTTTRGQTRPASTAERGADENGGGGAGGDRGTPAALAASPGQGAQPRTGIVQRGIVDPQRQRTDGTLMLPSACG
jgi:hypothetical protein